MSAPTLQHYNEFKEILADYHIGDKVEHILSQINLVVIASPTSGGRNTIINELVGSGKYELSISDTTRPPRKNKGVLEQDGVEYNFLSEEQFLDGLKKEEYVEASLIHEQQVSGTSIKGIEAALEHKKIPVVEANYTGVEAIHDLKSDTHCIFVVPPTFDVWMERLKARGDMHQDEFLNRLKSAEKELQFVIENDYFNIVINDDLGDAVGAVRGIVEEDEYSPEYYEDAKKIAWELLNRIKHELYS